MLRRILNMLSGRTGAPQRYAQLFDAIRAVRPCHILEVGTWTGSRGAQMIETAKRSHRATDIHYYGFDLFEEFTDDTMGKELSKRPPSMAEVTKRLQATGAHIHLYKGDTRQTLPEALASLPKMDVTFIDGGHSIETVESDWLAVSSRIAQNGVVIFDDYWQNRTDAGAKPTVDSIDRRIFSVELLPTIDRVTNDEFGRLDIRFAKVTPVGSK